MLQPCMKGGMHRSMVDLTQHRTTVVTTKIVKEARQSSCEGVKVGPAFLASCAPAPYLSWQRT